MEMIEEQAEDLVDLYADEKVHPEDWDLKGLARRCLSTILLPMGTFSGGRWTRIEII